MLGGRRLAVWIVIALLLTPTEAKPAVKDPAEWRNELKETLEEANSDVRCTPEAPQAPQVPLAPQAPARAECQSGVCREASEICADLSALSDPGALEGALARVSTLLNATGLIVWVASNDGGIAVAGRDPWLRLRRSSRASARCARRSQPHRRGVPRQRAEDQRRHSDHAGRVGRPDVRPDRARRRAVGRAQGRPGRR